MFGPGEGDGEDEHVKTERPQTQERAFRVLRCSSCGDTFPAEGNMAPRCRTCGSEDVTPAGEPLL